MNARQKIRRQERRRAATRYANAIAERPKRCPRCKSMYDFRGFVATCSKGHRFDVRNGGAL